MIFDEISKCYPGNLELSKTPAKCSVQSMVNHTLSRIMSISNTEYLDESETTGKTMFIGKAVNVITDTNSTQSCNFCSAKSSEINMLDIIREKVPNEQVLVSGLSTLHCWIRIFEFILYLGYKLSVEARKKEIKIKFREELSLVVDTPKQGFGNTNTRNTGRRAFLAAESFSEITGVSLDIIVRLRNILNAACSRFHLNLVTFKAYCFETSELIVETYP